MQHHLNDEYLMDYAAGSASQPLSLLVATHLALCPECRAKVADYEALGGALLDSAAPSTVAPDMLQSVLDRLDEPAAPESGIRRQPPIFDETTRRLIPEPLRSHLGASLDALAWSSIGRGVHQVDLDIGGAEGFKTRFYRIRGGCGVPQHTHDGSELTLVLGGSFSDGIGRFGRGDVSIADGDVVHQPIADAGDDCYCLAITDGPLKLTGPVGRFLNIFMRY